MHGRLEIVPLFVPMSLTKQNAPTIPNAVVNKVINKDMTPIRAWREKIAQALGIATAQLAV